MTYNQNTWHGASKLVAAGLVMATLIAACSSGGEDTTTTEADSTTSIADTTTTSTPTTSRTVATTTTAVDATTTTAPDATVLGTTLTRQDIEDGFVIQEPEDGATVRSRVWTFSGTALPGSTVAVGPFEADIDDDGNWSITLVLEPGSNGAEFVMTTADDIEVEKGITVIYRPQALPDPGRPSP